ncbi:MAG: iron-containing redox enzyme family protein [Candidatus Aenigmarchaeota archaeon]|nr:iron-containing redox enzyme family protein [Candidatus Aenigmarchaeota archaeon]
MNFSEELDRYENVLINKFKNHVVLKNISKLSDNNLKRLLLQRRLISLEFTPLYEQTICGLEHEEAKKILRWLIIEEYPPNNQNHREDLVTDMMKLGLTKKEILNVKPTTLTNMTIKKLFDSIEYSENNYDIKALSTLNIAMEVLVSEEYGVIIPELQKRFAFNFIGSAFYGPHYQHDSKNTLGGHSNKLNGVIKNFVDSKEKLEIAKNCMANACEIKMEFYDQFSNNISK